MELKQEVRTLLAFFIGEYMAKDYAKAFYKSRRWRDCRDAYMHSVSGLCERCLKQGRYIPAEIVHHKTYISPSNITNPEITLNWNNLEAVCRECHAAEHELGHTIERRYKVDEFGKIIIDPLGQK